MRYFRRALTVLIAPAAIVTAVALAAPAASAGTVHHDGLRPEFFTIKIVNHGNENNPGDVNAYGPVRGSATDDEVSNTKGIFTFEDGSTVNVYHSDVSSVQPDVNYSSCTATATATGHWAFLGGSGRYRHAFGTGQFRFRLFLVFRHRHHHRCVVNQNTPTELSVVNVTAWGSATAGRR